MQTNLLKPSRIHLMKCHFCILNGVPFLDIRILSLVFNTQRQVISRVDFPQKQLVQQPVYLTNSELFENSIVLAVPFGDAPPLK